MKSVDCCPNPPGCVRSVCLWCDNQKSCHYCSGSNNFNENYMVIWCDICLGKIKKEQDGVMAAANLLLGQK